MLSQGSSGTPGTRFPPCSSETWGAGSCVSARGHRVRVCAGRSGPCVFNPQPRGSPRCECLCSRGLCTCYPHRGCEQRPILCTHNNSLLTGCVGERRDARDKAALGPVLREESCEDTVRRRALQPACGRCRRLGGWFLRLSEEKTTCSGWSSISYCSVALVASWMAPGDALPSHSQLGQRACAGRRHSSWKGRLGARGQGGAGTPAPCVTSPLPGWLDSTGSMCSTDLATMVTIHASLLSVAAGAHPAILEPSTPLSPVWFPDTGPVCGPSPARCGWVPESFLGLCFRLLGT